MAEERAQAVRGLLIDKSAIAPERLVAVGLDAEKAPPEGDKRRVRVVNMASQQAAKAGE
jgi:hypothetical protein